MVPMLWALTYRRKRDPGGGGNIYFTAECTMPITAVMGYSTKYNYGTYAQGFSIQRTGENPYFTAKCTMPITAI